MRVVFSKKFSRPRMTVWVSPMPSSETVIRLARGMGYEVREADVVRTDLYHADEVFFTGTAAEITPIHSIDDHEVGAGPITKRIQTEFFEITHGRSELSPEYLDYPAATPAKA